MLPLALALVAGSPQPANPQAASATSGRIRVVPQHSSGTLQDLEESRDGSRLLTHDREFAPRLWDARRQIVLANLEGHPDKVDNVAFTDDGKRAISRSPKMVILWDAVRAKRIGALPAPAGDAFVASAATKDGSTIALGTRLGAVLLAQGILTTAKKIGGHTKAVGAFALSRDGARLFSGSEDGTGRVWDAKTGAPLWSVKGHTKGIAWADFSKSGLLATTEYSRASSGFETAARQKGAVMVWDVKGKPLATYPHWFGARGVELTWAGGTFVGERGDEIVTFDESGTMPIHRIGTAAPVRKLEAHKGSIRELRFSADRHYVSTVAEDDDLYMWDAVSGKKLPFDPGAGLYTAGDFSPTRPVFWLGYKGGDVRQFDLKTGKSTRETYSSVSDVRKIDISPDGGTLLLRTEGEVSGFTMVHGGQVVAIDPSGTHGTNVYDFDMENVEFAPDGASVAMNDRGLKYKFAAIDIWTGKIKVATEESRSFAWSNDGTRIVALEGDTGRVDVWDVKDRKWLKAWTWPKDKEYGNIEGPVFHPLGDWVVTFHHPKNEVLLWNWETGKVILNLGKITDSVRKAVFSKDGTRLFVMGLDSIRAIDVVNGKELWVVSSPKFQTPNGFTLSQDAKRIALNTGLEEPSIVFDAETGKELLKAESDALCAMTADGKRLLTAKGLTAWVWDIDTGKRLQSLEHTGAITDVKVFNDRFLTVDNVRGLNVWSAEGKRIATAVAMRDGTWLAYDEKGRYDSPTPSDVRGAYYTLEWEGGLEPIAMSQLKGQFYEPHLLGKALGIDKEPLRDVPDISGLRLYPDLTIKPEGEMAYSISAKERDEGGIGAVRVSINGKEVLKKSGSGFFKVDVKEFASYLLPEARLQQGEKNVLTVTAANEEGDLVGPPESVDLGVPANLKAPEVRLYALCIGVGDYAGTAGDLQAPPSDARAIAAALKETGERLLPGRVQVDVMATGGSESRPTRPNVLAWLSDVSKKATSSDIVFVFAAGHGLSRIGETSGYYLLTSEADPGEVTPAAAKTVTISGEELRAALTAIPAGKQVVVLDTCHSGAATSSLLGAGRSVSGEYQRAWEAIKDATGVWLLAGAASDQLSYESSNVEHGMLTYALLEAIDRASSDGLRQTPSGELFLDVERWLGYASNRVESLKSEVGLGGVQRPEFKRSTRGESFDLGVMDAKRKGFLELKPPMPIVIVGDFSKDEEDPQALEEAVASAMRGSRLVKPWFDVAKHPNVYRMTGTYTVEGDSLKVRVVLQAFDAQQTRKTLDTFEVSGSKAEVSLAVRKEVESRIRRLEESKKPAG